MAMKNYSRPLVKAVIIAEAPAREPDFNPDSIQIRYPIYMENLEKFHKQQLADTFSFKRKGFHKHQK
ncbi:MAG: hypothetical protein IJ584_13945 [Bacteroidales bacterium]|nr:hypothetical protein [Bacteroidales bacterium]